MQQDREIQGQDKGQMHVHCKCAEAEGQENVTYREVLLLRPWMKLRFKCDYNVVLSFESIKRYVLMDITKH